MNLYWKIKKFSIEWKLFLLFGTVVAVQSRQRFIQRHLHCYWLLHILHAVISETYINIYIFSLSYSDTVWGSFCESICIKYQRWGHRSSQKENIFFTLLSLNLSLIFFPRVSYCLIFCVRVLCCAYMCACADVICCMFKSFQKHSVLLLLLLIYSKL